MRLLFSLSIAALIAAPAAAPANPLIAAARESGLLDTETALLYELYEALEPASLPSEYRDEAPGPRGCATPLILDALEARKGGSPGYGSALAKILARPRLSHQVLSPSGRFRIHYDIEGENAVDPADADGNAIPDYVDVTAAVIDSMWHLEIETLGYDPPPTDGVKGGGDEYDIYIEQIPGGYYGLTQPEESGPRGHSYLRVDNNFTESIFGRASSCEGARGARELTALRVTLAHEFFHMIQFGYYQGSEGFWWQESSATWMEEVAYPEADDYLQYLCDFIRSPERSLESSTPGNRIYGSAIFSHFLDQRYGRQVVREIWEEHRDRESASLDNFHRALQRFGDREPGEAHLRDFGLGESFNEFATWNYFTGERHREGFYEEGHKYPAIEVSPRQVGTETLEDSGRVDHLASAYLALEPLDEGGVAISTDLEGLRWRRRLALVSPDSVEVRTLDIGNSVEEVFDWNFYSAVVLVVSNTSFTGIGFPYRVSAEYGSGMTGGRLPDEVVLENWFPNPFLPGRMHSQTRIRYALDSAGSGELSIFSADGRLVRRLDMEKRLGREYEVVWDGRNEAGKPVGSGLYYYVLDADGGKRQGTLAVVRE